MFEGKGLPEGAVRPIVYLSGFTSKLKGMPPEEEARQLIKRAKVKYRCYSHAFCCKEGAHYSKHIQLGLAETVKCGVRIMMDSGAFSFHQMLRAIAKAGKKSLTQEEMKKLRERTIDSYVEFCKKGNKNWDFYINYDYRPHAPTVYGVQKDLERRGLKPVPVFHGDDGLDWFKKYVDEGHKLICIGGAGYRTRRPGWDAQRRYFDIVFDQAEKYGVEIHGLAQTALSIMFCYPFASVDSATWAIVGTYGCILHVDRNSGKVGPLHVSTTKSNIPNSYDKMPKEIKKEIQNRVEAEGFDFQKVRTTAFERSIYNAKMFTTHIMELKKFMEKGKTRWESLA